LIIFGFFYLKCLPLTGYDKLGVIGWECRVTSGNTGKDGYQEKGVFDACEGSLPAHV